MVNEETTIRLRKETRDKLASIGKKDDSFDDLIEGLIYFWNRYKDVVRR